MLSFDKNESRRKDLKCMSKWERKFGKYAIPNLTLILLGCYVAGYVVQKLLPGLFMMLTLDPYKILQGQVRYRVFSKFSFPFTHTFQVLPSRFVLIER